jgi:ADP-ribose pyrophosphatase
MFDGSTKTFEMLKRPDTVQVIVLRDSDVLLINDEQPGRTARIHFPGGRADETDESWESAARRELKEETGITCQQWKLINVSQPIIKIEWFTPIFLATAIANEEPQQLDAGGERIELLWEQFDIVRTRVLSGQEQTMQYLVPLFLKLKTSDDLRSAAGYSGRAVER